MATGDQSLPTLYEYYTAGGVNTTLEAPASGFLLNGKEITIFSGAIHYFRVHPEYWQDRMRKLRAAGFNTLETYIPWNLHEPEKDVFDFGDGNRDFSMFLDVRKFIQLAQEEDLFVIIRPGPYICSEWDFGGLPSWLLRIPDIKVRTSDPQFTSRVKIYFDKLLPLLTDLQFTRGGPIIAVQIENEYGGFGKTSDPRDKDYLKFIKNAYEDNGLEGLFFTSDSPSTSGDIGSLPGVLQTANFNSFPTNQLDALKQLQPDRALMVMEFWSGWFDHWLEGSHQTGLRPTVLEDYLEQIFSYNASINVYMFHGGTSFGFMNGANVVFIFPYYAPDTSSYDYDAPLSEAGDYTEKYRILERVVAKHNKVLTQTPEKPAESTKAAYEPIKFSLFMTMEDILNEIEQEDKTQLETLQPMESLPVNNGNGQSYGYINYRKKVKLTNNSTIKISGHVRDIALLMLDNQQKTKIPSQRNDLHGFGFWPDKDQELTFEEADAGERTIDILVENAGRVNYGGPEDFIQKKGLWEGPVIIDGAEQTGWEATALQFKSQWVRNLNSWRQSTSVPERGPVLLKGTFEVTGDPADTWLDFSLWGKGIAFVNGFHLGRYFKAGPPKTLYIPAPLLHSGFNEVIIFEHYQTAAELTFRDSPIFNS
ncbi:beta-galactosidase-1-like protein 2 isoform X2 [Ischnura elegans]|uniref:beta-galactosidase-1-like protein 2 isoform X2 n=1 Tax=Ischnura elegans TaxID=197161 RepID=UPI001ED89484|nr:beta-galactosidase-1-like protein 2 isoform X2 [Ischnura elegans]